MTASSTEPSINYERWVSCAILNLAFTETTHGNAMGIGSADFVHRDIAAELGSSSSLINAITVNQNASSSLVEEARNRAVLEIVREPEAITFESGQFAAPSLRDV